MPVLPKHATDIERFPDASLAKPLGSGPYIVADVKPGARLLAKDPNYWGVDIPSQRGFYNFDEIDIQYYRDGNSLLNPSKRACLIIEMKRAQRAGQQVTNFLQPKMDASLKRS